MWDHHNGNATSQRDGKDLHKCRDTACSLRRRPVYRQSFPEVEDNPRIFCSNLTKKYKVWHEDEENEKSLY